MFLDEKWYIIEHPMGPFWRNFVKIGALFFLLIIIIIVNFVDKKHRRFMSFPYKIFSIPIYAIGKGVDEMKGFFRKYIYLVHVESENRRLREELILKELELNLALERLKELERLKDFLGYRETFSYSTIVAKVIGFSSDSSYRAVTIDAGENHGVKKGMPVVTFGGLAGEVIEAGPFSSKVLLLTDPNLSVDVLNTRTLERYLLTGDGKDGCRLKYYPKTGEAKVGDVLVTAGIGNTFPPGISIGVVISLSPLDDNKLFRDVYVQPFVNFSKMNEVLVIKR